MLEKIPRFVTGSFSLRILDVRMCIWRFNSLWPGRWWYFRWVLFKPITVIDGCDTCCEIALRRMSLNFTDDKSTLVQVMAWCRQATSHYPSQCWPSFLSPYGITPFWTFYIYRRVIFVKKYDSIMLQNVETCYIVNCIFMKRWNLTVSVDCIFDLRLTLKRKRCSAIPVIIEACLHWRYVTVIPGWRYACMITGNGIFLVITYSYQIHALNVKQWKYATLLSIHARENCGS